MTGRLLLVSALVVLAGGSSRVRRIVGGSPADPPPSPSRHLQFTTPPPDGSSPQLVFVRRDRRSAEVVGNRQRDSTYSFLGIRYAEPPIKRLRYVRPRRLKPKGLVDARSYGPPCPQWFYQKLLGREDCLFLNIYTPEIPTNGSKVQPSLPVLVWIHGGNFKTGSANQYVPTRLVRKGMVVVTIQYRLGSLGFFSLGRKELPGNAGLFDMALAVHWVRDYIRFFGGNPERIFTGGQGSGASSASHLVLNGIARRSVKGIVAMSGTPVSPFAIDESEVRSANEVAKVNQCTEKEGLPFVRCMQELPLETILKGDSNVEMNKEQKANVGGKLSNLFTPGPAEEGKDDFRGLPNFILESPLEAIKHKNFPKIPLLTGVTKQETGAGVKGSLLSEFTEKLKSAAFLTEGIFNDLLTANIGLYVNKTVNPSLSSLFGTGSQYLQFFTKVVDSALSDIGKTIQHTTDALFNLPAFILSTLWSQKSDVFLYSFEQTPTKSQANNFLNDINLVYNESLADRKDIDGPSHGDDLIYLFDVRTIEGEPIPESEMSEADQKVRDHFSTAVFEFVKTGIPKTQGGEAWTPFNMKDGNYMIFKEIPKLAKGFRKCAMGLWTGDSDLLGSAECALSAATKVVTDTLGSAGTGLLKSASSVQDTVGQVSGKVGEAAVQNINKVAKPLEKLPVIGQLGGSSNKKPGGSSGGLIPAVNKKPQKQGSGGLLGGLGSGGSSLFG